MPEPTLITGSPLPAKPSGRLDSRPSGRYFPRRLMTRPRSTLKETLLDAAETVASREGVSRLTFDAVAAEAGVSKGGLLHHFSSKDQLIEGMVKRSAEQWRHFYLDAYERAPEGPGRMARALLQSGFLEDDSWTEPLRRNFASVLAALVHDPSLVLCMREANSELYGYLRNDGLPPGVSEAVGAAIDGIWLSWAMRFCDVDRPFLKRMHGALKTMLDAALLQIAESPSPKKKNKTGKA